MNLKNSAMMMKWKAYRFIVDRGYRTGPFFHSDSQRALFITHSDKICESQFFPFYFYRKRIAELWDTEIQEVRLETFESGKYPRYGQADVVFVQTWFDIDADRLHRLFETIYMVCRPHRVIFLDAFAPLDLRLAEAVNDYIDYYVKKHVFRDRSQYGKPTYGDTNLMDYYGKRFGINHEVTLFPIPEKFLNKLVVGPGFATAPYMLPYFLEGRLLANSDQIDVHGRLAGHGTPWYASMRNESISAIEHLDGLCVVSRSGVTRKQYLNELSHSRICFSPFGYGETAWRDYEALLYGALLVKPDMSHIESSPDIYIANKTYVPVRWDLSDFEDTIRYYLDNTEERKHIVDYAFNLLYKYFVNEEFLKQIECLFVS